MHRAKTNRWPGVAWVLPLVATLVVACWAGVWWDYTIDDTYITLRYAENLVHGEGLVFNPGERIEGFSCPLWVFFLSLIGWLGGDILLASKAFGLLCGLGLVPLLYVALRRCSCVPLIAGAAALWLSVLPGIHVYACSGMETLPFALAVAWAAFLPSLHRSPRVRMYLLPVALLVVATLRPEGALVFVFLSLLHFMRAETRGIRVAVVTAWIALAVLLLVRYGYYGSFLPNTYLAKPSPMTAVISEGLSLRNLLRIANLPYATLLPAMSAIGGIGLLACAVVGLIARRELLSAASAGAAAGAGLIFLFYAPADWMPASRFSVPFLAPILFLAALGGDALLKVLPARQLPAARFVLAGLMIAWCFIGLTGTGRIWLRHPSLNSALNADEFYVPIGEWLREDSLPGDRLLAFEIGAVGYHSRLHVIDHEGLIDKEIGRVIQRAGGYGPVRWGHNPKALRELADIIVARRPDWFLVLTKHTSPLTEGQPLPPEIATEKIQNALVEAFGASMVLARTFPMASAASGRPERYLLLRRTGGAPTARKNPKR